MFFKVIGTLFQFVLLPLTIILYSGKSMWLLMSENTKCVLKMNIEMSQQICQYMHIA